MSVLVPKRYTQAIQQQVFLNHLLGITAFTLKNVAKIISGPTMYNRLTQNAIFDTLKSVMEELSDHRRHLVAIQQNATALILSTFTKYSPAILFHKLLGRDLKAEISDGMDKLWHRWVQNSTRLQELCETLNNIRNLRY